MSSDTPEERTADGAKMPSKLKLAFSKAADKGRISAIFEPQIKSQIDPHHFVVKRDQHVFDKTIDEGRAAFLYDATTGDVHALTMAYEVTEPQSGTHKYSEIGTSLARISGYRSALIVAAAMAIKEWWSHPPTDMIVTEILPDNAPSLHLYKDTMDWQEVTDTNVVDELFDLCNAYIAPEDQGREAVWFCCDSNVIPNIAQILLDYIDSGVLHNKRTGHDIPLDLSALHDIGLTESRLQAIASGDLRKPMPEQPRPRAPGP